MGTNRFEALVCAISNIQTYLYYETLLSPPYESSFCPLVLIVLYKSSIPAEQLKTFYFHIRDRHVCEELIHRIDLLFVPILVYGKETTKDSSQVPDNKYRPCKDDEKEDAATVVDQAEQEEYRSDRPVEYRAGGLLTEPVVDHQLLGEVFTILKPVLQCGRVYHLLHYLHFLCSLQGQYEYFP